MKKNILFALISLCLWACSEDEIKPYQGEQYLYFSQLINTTNDYDKENGYMEVSFNKLSDERRNNGKDWYEFDW